MTLSLQGWVRKIAVEVFLDIRDIFRIRKDCVLCLKRKAYLMWLAFVLFVAMVFAAYMPVESVVSFSSSSVQFWALVIF